MRIARFDVTTANAGTDFSLSAVQGVNSDASDLAPFRLEDFAGIATWAGKPIYNHDQVIAQLDSGRHQPASNGTITFSFYDGPTSTGLYNSPKYQGLGVTDGLGYSPFSEAQKAVAREAMTLWDDLIPQHI